MSSSSLVHLYNERLKLLDVVFPTNNYQTYLLSALHHFTIILRSVSAFIAITIITPIILLLLFDFGLYLIRIFNLRKEAKQLLKGMLSLELSNDDEDEAQSHANDTPYTDVTPSRGKISFTESLRQYHQVIYEKVSSRG